MPAKSLDRRRAAIWSEVNENALRYWERSGLLRRQNPGKRKPSKYKLEDLVTVRVLVAMRRDGISHPKMRQALRLLRRRLPDLVRRKTSRIVLTSHGRLVPEQRGRFSSSQVFPSRSNTGVAWMFSLERYVSEVQAALEEAAR